VTPDLTPHISHIQVGRAHFEMVQYPEALRAFERAAAAAPHRLCGAELHSTILWHLKREVPLCYLAKRCVDFDRLSAYTCCVVGNCFSLQKEHDTALKFFQRAIQVQPDLAYAYTLCGHEYSANDDFEKAMAFYRSAIRIDERHYNAWYGLGNIYFRQEKFDFAEHHLRKALAINPCSSPLYCYLGMALHANSKPTQALDSLSGATNPGGIPTHTPIPIPTAGARLPERRDQHRRAQPLGTLQEGGGAHLAGRVHRCPLRAHHADRGRTKGGLGLLHPRKGARFSLRTRRPPARPALRARAHPRDGPPTTGGVWLWPPPTTAS
jgi:hypothetical protein